MTTAQPAVRYCEQALMYHQYDHGPVGLYRQFWKYGHTEPALLHRLWAMSDLIFWFKVGLTCGRSIHLTDGVSTPQSAPQEPIMAWMHPDFSFQGEKFGKRWDGVDWLNLMVSTEAFPWKDASVEWSDQTAIFGHIQKQTYNFSTSPSCMWTLFQRP